MEVRHNREAHRFEAGAEPQLARLDYRLEDSVVDMTHTEVPAAYRGQGLAGKLATAALEWARAEGFKVIPTCPYIEGFIEKHSEFKDLLR